MSVHKLSLSLSSVPCLLRLVGDKIFDDFGRIYITVDPFVGMRRRSLLRRRTPLSRAPSGRGSPSCATLTRRRPRRAATFPECGPLSCSWSRTPLRRPKEAAVVVVSLKLVNWWFIIILLVCKAEMYYDLRREYPLVQKYAYINCKSIESDDHSLRVSSPYFVSERQADKSIDRWWMTI